MNRRPAFSLPVLALCALGSVLPGCSSTATVVPGKTLALLDVQYRDSRMTGVVLESGEESPEVRMGRAFLRELEREHVYRVVDARSAGVHSADLGKDPAKSDALRRAVPADAYLGIRLLGCAPRAMTETERRGTGVDAVEVTVYFYRGECTAEVEAWDANGRSLAVLQKTGRWDSPRQDRPDASSMQSQALTLAIDDTARRLAREIRPSAGGEK